MAELPFQCTAEEEATPSQPTLEETAKVVEVFNSEKDFEVFNQFQSSEPSIVDFNHLPFAQVSGVQEAPNIPNAMVLQRKSKTSLLELLESHVEGTVPKVAVQTRPLTPLPTQTSQPNPTDKKRKQDRKCKEVGEEGEVIPSKEPKP